MLVAMGSQGKRIPPLQGTGGLDHRGHDRDAVAWWLRGVVRFYPGERCAFLYPIALIYGTNTRTENGRNGPLRRAPRLRPTKLKYGTSACSERSMVRGACAFRSGKQSARKHRETDQDRRDGRPRLRRATSDRARLGNQKRQED